jgi:hypothetical protein
MNLKRFFKNTVAVGLLVVMGSCTDYLDVNKDPNAVIEAPIEQIFTSATASVGFFSGSDLNRYSALIAQQYSTTSQALMRTTHGVCLMQPF